MKVTIDTKEDKIEDIHKVLNILTHILQNKDLSSLSSQSSADTSNMMSMFGDDSPSTQPDKAPDFSSFLSLTKNSSSTSTPASKREEQPKIEYF